MQLTGHGGEVFSLSFSPDGKFLASASFDKSIFLWRVFGECDNYNVIKVCVLTLQQRSPATHSTAC